MRRLFLYAILITLSLSMKAQYGFHSAVVSDLSSMSPYFPMKLEIDGAETWVIVQNNDFYRFLVVNRIIEKENYFSFVVGYINGTSIFKYNEKDFPKKQRLEFLKINFYPDIVEDANKGKDSFIDIYVKEGFINVALEKEPLVVYYLFQWSIAVYNECESGNLSIKFEM